MGKSTTESSRDGAARAPCPCCAPERRRALSRRQALWSLTAAALAACAPGGEASPFAHDAPLLPRRRLNRLDEPPAGTPPVSLPVVDFHTHLQKRISAEDLVGLMDEVGVARLVLMPLYYGDRGGAINDGEGSDEQALDYARRYPTRFVPFVGMQREELNNPWAWSPSSIGRQLLRETDAKLRTGEFFGMGEFMLRFYPYTNRAGIRAVSDMDYPPDSWLMRQFADLSVKYRAPMVIHAEAEPHVTAAMIRLLEAHPEAIVVWAHNCGRSSAQDIRAMMARFSNLYADLGGMVYSGPNVDHYGVYFPRRTPWMHLVVNDRGFLESAMRQLFVDFSERFLIGTDIAHARVYARYAEHLPRWRYIFRQLPWEAARNIAFANAEHLFAAEPAQRRLSLAGRPRF